MSNFFSPSFSRITAHRSEGDDEPVRSTESEHDVTSQRNESSINHASSTIEQPMEQTRVQTQRRTNVSRLSHAKSKPKSKKRSKKDKKMFKYNGCLKKPSGEVHPAVFNALCQLDNLVTNASIKCTCRQASIHQRSDRRLRIHAPNKIILRDIGKKNLPSLTEVRVVHKAVTVVANLWLPLRLLSTIVPDKLLVIESFPEFQYVQLPMPLPALKANKRLWRLAKQLDKMCIDASFRCDARTGSAIQLHTSRIRSTYGHPPTRICIVPRIDVDMSLMTINSSAVPSISLSGPSPSVEDSQGTQSNNMAYSAPIPSFSAINDAPPCQVDNHSRLPEAQSSASPISHHDRWIMSGNTSPNISNNTISPAPNYIQSVVANDDNNNLLTGSQSEIVDTSLHGETSGEQVPTMCPVTQNYSASGLVQQQTDNQQQFSQPQLTVVQNPVVSPEHKNPLRHVSQQQMAIHPQPVTHEVFTHPETETQLDTRQLLTLLVRHTGLTLVHCVEASINEIRMFFPLRMLHIHRARRQPSKMQAAPRSFIDHITKTAIVYTPKKSSTVCVECVSAQAAASNSAVVERDYDSRLQAKSASSCDGQASARDTNDDINDNDIGDFCPICQCLFEANDLMTVTSCGHNFHVDCLIQWLLKRRTCPICRADLVQNSLGREKDLSNHSDSFP